MSGPKVLRQKPATAMANRDAYQLDVPASWTDYTRLRTWVEQHGGEVPYLDSSGALIRSIYLDGCDRYHEWVSAPALVIHDATTGEFDVVWSTNDYDVVDPDE